MIRMSTKGRYGARLMVNLASRSQNGDRAVILKNISEEEGISIRYLEQIIIPLKINRLVKSIRGAGGGYILAKPAPEISLREILHALEGSCCLVECVEDGDYCQKISYCATYDVWKGATDLLKDFFENISLQDLVDLTEKKKKTKDKQKSKSRRES